MTNRYLWVIAAAAVTVAASTAHATTTFDDNVTPGIIMGTGIGNGAFTVDRASGIEIGLRGKLRFNSSNLPEGTYNSNGDGSYSFQGGTPPTGFSWDPGSPTTPVWSFEWSINTNWNGTSNYNLADLDYTIEIDGDPGAGTDFGTIFDPINVPFADHSIGTNATGAGAGVEAGSNPEYANLIATNNVAQNSWNYEFFNESTDGFFLAQLASFNPNVAGIYTIRLNAFNGDTSGPVVSTSIDINVSAVPIPPALPLFLSGLIGLGAVARRKRKQAAA